MAVMVFRFVANVEFIVFNEPSTYVFKGYPENSISIVFVVLVNGVENVEAFSFVANVEFIVFNEPSTYVFKGYADKSIYYRLHFF
jgi:hypothetical protein